MVNAWRRLPISEYGAMPYLWLIYVAAVPVTLWGSGASPRLITLQLSVLVVFLALYIGGYGRRGPINLVIAGAIAILGAIASPSDAVSTTYFIYAATFLPWGLSAPAAYRVLAVYVPLVALYTWLLHVNVYGAIPAVVFSLVIGVACINGAEEKRAHARLEQAHDQIERLAHIAERERIARDLHDVLGHTLSLIVLKAELAGRLIERDPQRAAQEIADVEKTARTALSEVREAIGGYRSQGLPAEMELARNTLQAAGVTLSCESPLPHLHAAEETVLCLAVREAVTNIVRHAQATHCRMRFTTSNDGYHSLLIADDGSHPNLQEGNGLRGMRERVQSVGGRLSITADPGVTLLIELPQTTTQRQLATSCGTL
jgi:two-component system, NarL family, sensor histidine kinase DesK